MNDIPCKAIQGSKAIKTVFILGIGSDIGRSLAEQYSDEGYVVIGTCRSKGSVLGLEENPNITILQCNLAEVNAIDALFEDYRRLSTPWDLFISCIGNMNPIGRFFDLAFHEWQQSVIVNSVAQLHVLHGMYPLRRRGALCHVALMAGGGTNGTFRNYSAYCVSKIALIKMCELLDDENPDLNIFIVGPGWVRTKIHNQTIGNEVGSGENYRRTLEFFQSNNPGTSLKDIRKCIDWCIGEGKEGASGRNFSVVNDYWRSMGGELGKQLRRNINKFKLRRFLNEE